MYEKERWGTYFMFLDWKARSGRRWRRKERNYQISTRENECHTFTEPHQTPAIDEGVYNFI